MTLDDLIEQMQKEAKRSGTSRAQLRGGVKVVCFIHRQTTIAVWRRGKKLSDTEIMTFYTHFSIPAHAVRLPAKGQEEKKVEHERESVDGTIEKGIVTWYGVAWMF